jgi:hypothetical protein
MHRWSQLFIPTLREAPADAEVASAVGGDINAPVVNVNASDGSVVNVKVEQRIARSCVL